MSWCYAAGDGNCVLFFNTTDMEVYFIRHTTPLIAKGICYGQTDLELASTFQEEYSGVLKQLPSTFETVYSSPLKRCLLLAKILKSERLIQDSRLMELNFGDWEMKPWDNLPKEELTRWMEDYVQIAPPGGESMMDLKNRVLTWWDSLLSSGYQRLAVVTHSGVIRVMNAYLSNIPLSEAFNRINIPYGGITAFRV